MLCFSFRLCTRKLFYVLEKIVVFYLQFLWKKKLWLKKQRKMTKILAHSKGGGKGVEGRGNEELEIRELFERQKRPICLANFSLI